MNVITIGIRSIIVKHQDQVFSYLGEYKKKLKIILSQIYYNMMKTKHDWTWKLHMYYTMSKIYECSVFELTSNQTNTLKEISYRLITKQRHYNY